MTPMQRRQLLLPRPRRARRRRGLPAAPPRRPAPALGAADFAAARRDAAAAGAVQGRQRRRVRRSAQRLARAARPLAGRAARPLLPQRSGADGARRRALPPLVRRRRHGPAVHASPTAGVSHRGRLVRTHKLLAEQRAGRFLCRRLGTHIDNGPPASGPDAFNTANTSVDRARRPRAGPVGRRLGLCAGPARPVDAGPGDLARRPAAGAVLGPSQGRRQRPPVEHRHLRRQDRRLAHRRRRASWPACRSASRPTRTAWCTTSP